jgi:hypothetical protein
MEKFSILLGYFDKQLNIINKLYTELAGLDLAIYDKQFVFALRCQQFYTAIEDLFKQIAKTFENRIDKLDMFHKEMLLRMNTAVPKIRPAVISQESLVVLDKIRAFRHFIRHAYNCELDEKELRLVQQKLLTDYLQVDKDLKNFRLYITKLVADDGI